MNLKNTKSSLVTFATLGLVTLFGSPAQAFSLGGTFSIFLDCNNDGMAQNRNANINGWQFTQDASGDNTDGPLYDMLGMATTITDDGTVAVVLNGNTSLTGEGNDRSGNSIAWGDLFFTAGNQTFAEAHNSGNLFAINFSQANDSNAPEVGVYNNVTAQGVGMHNFGHRTYENYMNLVDSDVNNFLGDIQANDLDSSNPYYDLAGPGYNVMAQGTRAYNDGFSFIDDTRLSALGFDATQFDTQGQHLIAFEFNLDALTVLPPLTEQAEQLGVDWIWDDDLQAIEDEYNRLDEEQRQIFREEIRDHSRENRAIREATPGFSEALANRDAAKEVRNAANERQGYYDFITATEAEIAILNDRELNDPTWNTKDEKYRKFLKDEIVRVNTLIQNLENDYGVETLATAQEDWQTANRAYSDLINQIRADNPVYVTNEEAMREPIARRQQVKEDRDRQEQLREALEQEIQDILASARQDIITQANAREEALEEEFGVRTSATNRNATTLSPISSEEEPVDVPEPSTTASLMLLGLAWGSTKLRSRNKR